MNKVSRHSLVGSKVSFEVTVPGLTKDDFPELDEHNCKKIYGCADCRAYAYSFKNAVEDRSNQRFTDENSSMLYIMFTFLRAADNYVRDLTFYYDEKENSIFFTMDFGVECEVDAEKFFDYLFLNCGH